MAVYPQGALLSNGGRSVAGLPFRDGLRSGAQRTAGRVGPTGGLRKMMTATGRRVRAETGSRVPVAGGDFSITVTRIVRYRDGRTTREPFTTRYEKPVEDK